MRIQAIYRATEGEGIFIGRPQVFVRFFGCKIHCVNCDSKYTWAFNSNEEMSIDEVKILIEKESYNKKISWITLTGGDPLALENIADVTMLAQELLKDGYKINIEASGNKIEHTLFDLVNFISIDYKTPSSKVESSLKNIEEMMLHYPGRFQVKSVITDKFDFDYVLNANNNLINKNKDFVWCLTPAYNDNEKFPMKRFQDVLKWNELAGGPFRVIGQQHKWIYGSLKKNV